MDCRSNRAKARAQMDNSMVTDFESKITIETDATTNFVEDASVVNGATTNTTNLVSTYVETNADIKAFLNKPILIRSGQWTTADAQGAGLYVTDIAGLLTGNAMWMDKIKGFNLVRGDCMVKVVLNASPFQQGRLLLHYLPNFANRVAVNALWDKFKNKNLIQKFQHPHVEIDTRVTSTIFRIPYIAPTPWYAIKEQYYDWGRFWLDVLAPLKTGPSAPVAQAYVDYSIYVWWENFELNAPTVPQSSGKVIRRGGSREEKEAQGTIEQGLRRVGKVAEIVSGIPLVGSYASSLSWASNIAASVASVFGWSKPRETEGQTNVYKQLLRYAGTCDGPNTAFPGGLTTLNRIETIDYGSFTNEDEMSLKYLYSIPYFAGTFTWAVGDGPGTSKYSHKLSPTSFLVQTNDVVAGHTATYESHVPFTYMARFHTLWRGSLNVTLKFVKTQMHSGRLQVTWTPINDTTTTPDLTSSSFSKRAIIDIRTEDAITFELPYLLYSDYAPTYDTNYEYTTSGQLDIRVLNDLRAPESCSQDIDVLVFISAGEDYELAAPSIAKASPVPYIPQSSSAVLVRKSEEQGNSMGKMEIGGKNATKDDMFHAKRCIGEKMMSVKSYLLRNSPLQTYTGGTFTPNGLNYMVFDPWFISAQMLGATGLQKTSNLIGDAFSLIAPMFDYCRGSVNWLVNDTNAVNRATSVIVPDDKDLGFGTQPNGTVYVNNSFFNSINLTGTVNFLPFEPCNVIDDVGLCYQHVPYYNKFPFSFTSYYNSVDDLSTDYSRAITKVQFGKTSIFSAGTTLQRSVGDDFQLMFFTGCPNLLINYV